MLVSCLRRITFQETISLFEAAYRRLLAQHHPVGDIKLVSSCWDTGARSNCDFCGELAQGVVGLLMAEFPQARVELQWNQPVLSDFATLSCARVVICSPSTFCLFAGLLAGHAIIPRSTHYFDRTTPDLGPSVEWFEAADDILTSVAIRRWASQRAEPLVRFVQDVLDYLENH